MSNWIWVLPSFKSSPPAKLRLDGFPQGAACASTTRQRFSWEKWVSGEEKSHRSNITLYPGEITMLRTTFRLAHLQLYVCMYRQGSLEFKFTLSLYLILWHVYDIIKRNLAQTLRRKQLRAWKMKNNERWPPHSTSTFGSFVRSLHQTPLDRSTFVALTKDFLF